MTSTSETPDQYINLLTEDRKEAIGKLRKVILDNLPEGFVETMAYGMIAYVVPHSIYPNGYHCDPKQALPFISIASQKNYIALHHLGIYGSTQLLDWVIAEYPKHSKTKLDMGKGCIRFKKIDQIPFNLIVELCKKITTKEWISFYESNFKR
jgi:hypothetical protein